MSNHDSLIMVPPSKTSTEVRITAESIYSNGVLKWGEHTIKDEDIITVVEEEAGYRVLSLNELELCITPTAVLPKEFLDRWLFNGLPAYLQEDVYILVSIRSGTGLAEKFLKVLSPILDAIGVKRTVISTKNAESVKDFVKGTLLPAAYKGKKQTVLMLSGDGGVVESINSLGGRSKEYTKPVIALFPLGTGNALFHSLHKLSSVPSIYVQGLRTLLNGTPKSLPIFKATFSHGSRLLTNEGLDATKLKDDCLYGAVVASYGLHSTLVADSDTTEYRKHGDKRFGMVAKDLLEDPHAYQADVSGVSRKDHGYLLWSMVSNLEKGFTISPKSLPLDGKLWFVHFGVLSGKEAMDVMGCAYQGGKHVLREEVGYEEVNHVKVSMKEKDLKWRRVCIDGAIVAVEDGGWFEVSLVEKEDEVLYVVVDE